MSETLTHIAVLTGDIIGSTQMSPEDLERAFEALSDCAETLAKWHGEDLHFTRQRGDGWQVRLARPELALRSALAFRAALRCEGKEFSTFMAVAEGMAPNSAPDENLNKATDEPFVTSGRLLETLKQVSVNLMDHTALGARSSAFVLADHISQSWTPAQAAAMLPILSHTEPPSHSENARNLGKSRQAVTKSLDGAGLAAIWLSLKYIENEEAKND